MRGILTFILFSAFYFQSIQSAFPLNKCNVCIDIANNARRSGNDSESVTRAKAVMAADAYTGDAHDYYLTELNCHWDKYYSDANSPLIRGQSPAATCGDTGCCPASYQIANFTVVNLVGTNSHMTVGACNVPKIVLLHHTVTRTIEETLDAFKKNQVSVQYIVARNGSIYQLFNDAARAWHAGAGKFGLYGDVNSHSVGIEIVNSGSEPFEAPQLASVDLLVKTLKLRWKISDNYVIGHMEIAPDRKQDPSGYFPWEDLTFYLNIFPGLYMTSLTPAQQSEVIFNDAGVGTNDYVTSIQRKLQSWGYNYLPMREGSIDQNTKFNIQSFNRRYCPEIYKKEEVVKDDTVLNPFNQQWFKLSDERLTKLMAYPIKSY